MLKYAPDFAIILKRQLTYVPLFGLYLIASQQIAIDRARGRQALQQIAAAAKPVFAAGRQVFIYPEGTRRLPAAPPRYKQGAAALYAETGAACLPVAVNTGLFWRRRGFLRRPGVAVIEYLPVIAPGLDRAAFQRTPAVHNRSRLRPPQRRSGRQRPVARGDSGRRRDERGKNATSALTYSFYVLHMFPNFSLIRVGTWRRLAKLLRLR